MSKKEKSKKASTSTGGVLGGSVQDRTMTTDSMNDYFSNTFPVAVPVAIPTDYFESSLQTGPSAPISMELTAYDPNGKDISSFEPSAPLGGSEFLNSIDNQVHPEVINKHMERNINDIILKIDKNIYQKYQRAIRCRACFNCEFPGEILFVPPWTVHAVVFSPIWFLAWLGRQCSYKDQKPTVQDIIISDKGLKGWDSQSRRVIEAEWDELSNLKINFYATTKETKCINCTTGPDLNKTNLFPNSIHGDDKLALYVGFGLLLPCLICSCVNIPSEDFKLIRISGKFTKKKFVNQESIQFEMEAPAFKIQSHMSSATQNDFTKQETFEKIFENKKKAFEEMKGYL